MSLAYDVYIERAEEASQRGRAELAAIIAQRFHVSESKTKVFLAMGRVKARGGVDRDTARALAAQLEGLGAVVSIVEVPDLPGPAREGVHGVPPPPPVMAPGHSLESGLAAAYEPVLPPPPGHSALGPIENPPSDKHEGFTLASLDDREAAPAPIPIAESERHQSNKRHLTDKFSPPSKDAPVELVLATPTRTRTPATGLPAPAPVVDDFAVAQERAVVAREYAEVQRKRIVLGGVLALVLGFIPAHFYGSAAEDRYDEISSEATTSSVPANDREYQLAYELWQISVERLHRTHGRIQVTSAILWLLASGAVALVWFKWIRPAPEPPPRAYG